MHEPDRGKERETGRKGEEMGERDKGSKRAGWARKEEEPGMMECGGGRRRGRPESA